MRIAREEIFGPVLTVTAFDTNHADDVNRRSRGHRRGDVAAWDGYSRVLGDD